MKSLNIAVIPGDGIGPEVTTQAVRVLNAVSDSVGEFQPQLTEFDWGADYYHRHRVVVPDDYLETLRTFDAIFLGAMGWPAEIPDHVTLAPLVRIRQAFDQYACIRPARLPTGVASPLAGRTSDDVDFVVIRENSEGEYVDLGSRHRQGKEDEFALQTAVHSRRGVSRILRFAFEMAKTRRGKLTMITKSNAQRFAYGLWDDLLAEIAPEFPAVDADRQHCDAAAMNLVRRPEAFDVIVASNLFGDLLTDLGGIIAGGLGLAPSTNTNPEREFPSMFEPVHGSAPDIAGQGIANPAAAMLSAAMMLDWLGADSSAAAIRASVDRALADGCATVDLGGTLSTEEFGDAVLERLATSAK